MTSSYYRPSGNVPRAGVLIVALVSLATLPSAWVYALATSKAAVVIDPWSAFGMSVWLSVLVKFGASRGKIRNPRWMGRAGACLGLLAWYLQWAAWMIFVYNPEVGPAEAVPAIYGFITLCSEPGLIVQGMVERLDNHTSSFLRSGLILCWLIELCAHIFPPMLAGRNRASEPFCDAKDGWAREIEVPFDFEPVDEPEIVRRRLETDPEHVFAILVPRPDDAGGSHARLTLHHCPGGDSFVTISNFIEIAPEAAPLPAAVRNAADAASDHVSYFAEAGEPIVELLRVSLPDPDAMLHRWSEDGRTFPAGPSASIMV